jgi:hypothetical protein
VRAAVGKVPVTVEPGEQQLRLQAREHGAALIIGAEVAVSRCSLQALYDLAVTDRLVSWLRLTSGAGLGYRHGAGDGAAELAQQRVQVCRVADAAALGEPFTLAALKRVSPEETARCGRLRAFGRTDPNDSVSVTGPGRCPSAHSNSMRSRPPGATGNPPDLLAVQARFQPVSHQIGHPWRQGHLYRLSR